MRARLSLRAQLVMLVLAAGVPLLASSIHRALKDADTAMDRVGGELRAAAAMAADRYEGHVESTRHLLSGIAAGPGLDLVDRQACERYFADLRKQFPVYANLGLAYADGSLACDALETPEGSVRGSPYFQQFVKHPGFAVGGYTRGLVTRREVLVFGYTTAKPGCFTNCWKYGDPLTEPSGVS
ncbi:MAG: hypothetical protein EOO54_16330, partial [Haliea sp.]